MTPFEFARDYSLVHASNAFDPKKLLPNTDELATIIGAPYTATCFDFFRDCAKPHKPRCLVAHLHQQRAAPIKAYAIKHRVRVVEVDSWKRRGLVGFALFGVQ
jgi:hypothetical protein